MHRTTILLPEELKARAERIAARDGVSLSELIRRGLEGIIEGQVRAGADPLWTDDAVYEGPAPRDLVAEHDRYLYDTGRTSSPRPR
ncbi:MAG: CopG family transcriptional regulator [Thermoanaerobaculia bacterium]